MFLEASDFPFIKVLEDNVSVIRDEMESLHPELFMDWPYYPVKDWKVYGFRFHDKEYDLNKTLCPKTTEILSKLPIHITTAGFSRLGPKGVISPHEGDSEVEYTCHLGLKVPEKVYLKSGDEIRPYIQDKCLVFDDLETHLAWNESEEPRVTLMIRWLKGNDPLKLREISPRMSNIMYYKNKKFYKKQHENLSTNPN